MVHLSDLSWSTPGEEAIKAYEKGQTVKAKVLDIDVEKERVSLGIKQLDEDPMEHAGQGGGALRKNQIVTATVTEVNDGGIEVALADGVKSFIRRADLARDRNDQRPERFGKGDKIDAMVTSVDKASRKVALSIKAREISEEKDAVAQFGSSDSGADRMGRVSPHAPFSLPHLCAMWGKKAGAWCCYLGTKYGAYLFGTRIMVCHDFN